MRATFSYASILHAVGQVLDQVSVKSIALTRKRMVSSSKGLMAKASFGYRYVMTLPVCMTCSVGREIS